MALRTAKCLCRSPRAKSAQGKFFATDAAPPRRSQRNDPTHTLPIQRRWNRDLDLRWAALKRMLPTVVQQRLDPVNHVTTSYLTGQADPVITFQGWLDEALRQVVLGGNGAWTLPYVRNASDQGALHARSATSDKRASEGNDALTASPAVDRTHILQSLAITELQGILEATSQRVVRAFANGYLTKKSPSFIAAELRRVIDGVGVQRGHALTSFMVVKAHATATLDVLRASGVQRVGIVPEKVAAPVPQIRDAKLRGMVGVLTAEDELVCPTCEEIAEEGPYYLDEAEALIPAHIHCRCGFVPADEDEREEFEFEDAFDPNQPRDDHGRWVAGGGYDLKTEDDHEILLGQTLSSPLSGKEEAALNGYTTNDYYDMNRALRFGLDANTKNIDSVFARASLPVDMEVYRQVDAQTYDQIAETGEYRDRAFVSTTADRERLPKNHVLTLQLPKGSRAIPLGHLSDHEATEAEMLVDRDQLFQVVSRENGLTLRLVREIKDSATHIAAGVMIEAEDTGRVLFVRRGTGGDHAGEWALPAGAVEPGETIHMAASREVEEEIGQHTPTHDLEEIDRRTTNGVDFTTYLYLTPTEFRPHLNHEHTTYVWRSRFDPPRPLHPGVLATLQAQDRELADESWDPSEHPRDKDGKFTFKGGGHGDHIAETESKILELVGKVDAAGVPYWHNTEDFPLHEAALEIPSDHADFLKMHAKKLGLQVKEHPAEDYGDQDPDDPHSFFTFHNDPPTQAPVAPGYDALSFESLTPVSGKKGSNPGGVYKDENGDKLYVKHMDKDHAQNERLAAALYGLAGAKTMDYQTIAPSKDGTHHIATWLETLDKDNVSQFNADERYEAQKDFAIHAWLANWDAAGTGGDNQVVLHGHTATVDVGGSLKYRAQGTPKGDAFGTVVTETKTMRDPKLSPDGAKLYGNMTDQQMIESIERVTKLSSHDIQEVVDKYTSDLTEAFDLASKLVKRQANLAMQAEELKAKNKLAPAPQPQPFAAPTEDHPTKKYLSQVKGNSPERVAWRKDLKTASSLAEKKEIQGKIIASFWKQHDKTFGPKKQDIADKLAEYAKKYNITNPLVQQTIPIKPAPAAAPTPIPVSQIATPSPSVTPSKATEAELLKAQKTTKLQIQHVPGAPQLSAEAQKLVDKYNEKYEGKALAGEALHQKVADFKALVAAMEPLKTAEQKQLAENLKKAEAAIAAKAAEEKAKQEALLNDPAVKAQYDTLAAIAGHSKAYLDGMDKFIAKNKLDITPQQAAFIRAYIGSSYKALNDQLRLGVATVQQAKYAQYLSDALKKMPVYEGTVYRGIPDPTGKVFESYASALDKVKTEFQFTSAGVKGKLWGDLTLEIVSKRARDIRSFNPGEGGGEVVFRMNSKFHVVKVDKAKKKVWLEEL